MLVELKQPAAGVRAGQPQAVPLFRAPGRIALGDLELVTLSDGFFALDGGAMFGVVPRTLWERRLPPDDSHRVPLGMRPLVVHGDGTTLLIDAGCGDKMDAKSAAIYGLDRALSPRLTRWPTPAWASDDIDIVVASHLHFDHIGGFTERLADGALVPRFPNARYVAHVGEWHDATHPHERNRASYLPENFQPLMDAGVLTLVDDDAEIVPGVRYRRSGGHTAHHQVVTIASQRPHRRLHRRHVSDDRAHSRSVGDGLRPVSRRHAVVQARASRARPSSGNTCSSSSTTRRWRPESCARPVASDRGARALKLAASGRRAAGTNG